jgi:hypothetical protein
VAQRTRLRNQVHAVLARNLIQAPVTDVFGQAGRRWLAELALPAHEREQVDSNLRLHDALDREVELVEGQLAGQALADGRVRRLMTIPGVGAITALALVAVIGDVTRFSGPRQLVGYLGLDPRVRQSGEKAARHGHISRAGQAHARGLLVEAAHVAIRTPGPLRAFHARIAARRGKQIALCATARKLAVLAWHLLSKDEDYRYGAPTIPSASSHAAAQGRGPGPPNQPGRRDQAQGARAALPRGGRAQLPPLRRREGQAWRGRRQRGRDCCGRQSGRRCAADSSVPRRLLFSFGVTRAERNSRTQPLTFSSVCAGWLPQDRVSS